jgi:hypothetical protein
MRLRCTVPDGTQGDAIVLRTDQEVERDERLIEEFGPGRGQVFELGDVELVPQLLASADLLRTDVATSCAIPWRELVGRGAVLEEARLFNACPLAGTSRRLCKVDCMFLIVGVLWTMLWEKRNRLDARAGQFAA